MNFNLKKRRVVVIIVIFVLLLIAGGFFYWWVEKEEVMKPIYKNEFVKTEEFEVVETSEGNFVVCEKENFRIKVPGEWRVEKDAAFGTAIYLLDPLSGDNFIKNAKEKGACGMSVEIYNSKRVNPDVTTFADDLNKEVEYFLKDPDYGLKDKDSKKEIINLDGKYGIKRIHTIEDKVCFIEVKIPIDQTVYTLSSGFIRADKCIEEFNKNLETVTINKQK